MTHTKKDKDKLVMRIKRIRGQLNAAEKFLEEEKNCTEILHSMIACRAAMGSLISELLQGHILNHVVKTPDDEQKSAAEELISIIKTYLK